jgi:methylenetetrahydrofolate dehydrogenase (NADP+)/methenyltetrahydrofolate cyclohydrolase
MATIIDGKKVAAAIKEEVRAEVAALRQSGIRPKLAVVLVGEDPASVLYSRSIEKSCKFVNVEYELFEMPAQSADDDVIALLRRLNRDDTVHGILLELPLPPAMNKRRVLNAVSPLKDVDGVHPINRGYILSDGEGLFPTTPNSCIEILLRNGIEISGKHAVLVGRGVTVGKPLIFMMLNQNATVTVCHTKTNDLPYHTRQADILVSAVGKAGMITADMIKPGAVVIDAGINSMEGGGICGDVDFVNAEKVAGAISPVPGGVGSITTALIHKNVIKAIKMQQKENAYGESEGAFFDKSLREVIDLSSSRSPTPGGGSVSAIAACFGLAMITMACNLTLGKEKYKEVEPQVKIYMDTIDGLSKRLALLTEDDMTAYSRVMAAYRMKRSAVVDNEARDAAIQEALKYATDIPMEIAQVCLAALQVTCQMSAIGNKAAVSDAGVAAVMTEAALNGVLLNVDINTASIKDEDYNARIIAEKEKMLAEASRLKDQSLALVRRRISE